MTYSKAHQKFAEYLENPEALTNPQVFLGPNSETVLNFWKWMDSLTEEQWSIVADRYRNLDYATWATTTRDVARIATRIAAKTAAGDSAWIVAWNAASFAARISARTAASFAAEYATCELMGMHIILEKGKKLTFVPMFDGI